MKNSIAIIGMPGAGKTTVCRVLSRKLKIKSFDTDEEIEKLGMSVVDIFKNHGEKYFRELEKEVIFKLSNVENIIVSIGGGAIENENIIKENFSVLYLKREINTIFSSIKTSSRPLVSVKSDLIKIYEKRKEIYERMADFTVKNNSDIKTTINNILKLKIF